jgi:hypothetical protein
MEDPNDRLLRRISLLLRDSLGAVPWSGSLVSKGGKLPSLYRATASWSPAVSGGVSGLIYAVLFAGLPWLVPGSSQDLFWLSVWGSCYFALAVATARSASGEVFQIIQNRVLPLLSPEAVAVIDRDLEDRFGSIRIQVVSLGSALVAALISVIAIRQDVFPNSLVMSGASVQITYCCIGLFFLFLTAARTTDVARFYSTFAAHLHVDSERIYSLDPARSVLVTSVASIGQRVLLFWFGIACSVVTLFVLFWWRHLFWFVLLVVPIASFFSLGVGTIVFLGNEQKIRHVVNGIVSDTQLALERDITALDKDRYEVDEAKWARFKELMELRNSVASALAGIRAFV